MIDFSSALYLGLRHASDSLRPWAQLTGGIPAALWESPEAERVAADLARLQGCRRAVMIRSTLHAFWDVFADLSEKRVTIYADKATYPIARWGLTAALSRGVPLRIFRHQDAGALAALVERDARSGRAPVVLADGFCPDCGRHAPLESYVSVVAPRRGRVVLDDTQALGIYGVAPSTGEPYGTGGGGTPRFTGVKDPHVLVVASLAKGFGAPVAGIAGADVDVSRLARASDSRVHCSPPSAADLRAAAAALHVNRVDGNSLRKKVLSLVMKLRGGLSALDIPLGPSLFPMQTVRPRSVTPARLQRDLRGLGIRTVLHEGKCTKSPRVSVLVTARHRMRDIDRALEAIERCMVSRRAGLSR